MVVSIFTNNSIKLNSIEKSIFSEIQFYSLLIEKSSNTLSREDFSTMPALVNMVKVVDAGTLWFESNNKDAYDKLFEQNLSIEPEKDKIRSENELFHISLDNDMPNDAKKVGVDWDETEDIGIVTNYKGKPYTGVCYSLHKNGGLEQYYMLKDGLKEGVGKEFYENGEISYWCLCKNDITTCAIEFENGLKYGDWVVVKNKDKMKRGYSKDKFFISFSELSEGKNFSLSYDDIKSGKYDEEIFNINRGMGFIFMNSGLINYYTKNSPHMWIPDAGLSEKDGKLYYPDLTLKQDSNPKLVNGIVYDVHFDGSIKCTAKFTDGLIDGETIYYDIGKF